MCLCTLGVGGWTRRGEGTLTQFNSTAVGGGVSTVSSRAQGRSESSGAILRVEGVSVSEGTSSRA